MIELQWSQRDRRALLGGAAVMTALLAGGRGVPRLTVWATQRRAEAEHARHDAALARREASLLPVFAETLAARRRRLDVLDTMLIAGATVAEAGAELSNTVSDYSDSRSVRVMSIQVRPDSVVTKGFARVAVRLSGMADVAGLTSLLGDIESGTPVLAVRALSVAQPDPAVASSKPEALRFELLVEALAVVRKGER